MATRKAKRPHQSPPAARKRRGQGDSIPPDHTPVTSLRIPPALLARADELVPLLAATGEAVGVNRSVILRLALAEGLRVLRRRYMAAED